MLKRLKVITGYQAHFRFLSELTDEPVGFIPRQKDIPSPYASSKMTWRDRTGVMLSRCAPLCRHCQKDRRTAKRTITRKERNK